MTIPFKFQIICSGIIVGLMVAIICSIVGFLMSINKFYPKPDLPESCSNYNKFFIMDRNSCSSLTQNPPLLFINSSAS